MDRLAQAFTTTITIAADATIPRIRPCERSKPWWTKDLNKLRKALHKALRRYKKSRSIPDHTAWKRTRNQYFHAIREAKTQHWENFLMNATGKEVFTAAKYTRPAVQIKIPNIQTENSVACTFEEKCQAFLSTLFPASPPHPSVPPNTAYEIRLNQSPNTPRLSVLSF